MQTPESKDQKKEREVFGIHEPCGRTVYRDELLPKDPKDKDNVWIDGICPHCRRNCVRFVF